MLLMSLILSNTHAGKLGAYTGIQYLQEEVYVQGENGTEICERGGFVGGCFTGGCIGIVSGLAAFTTYLFLAGDKKDFFTASSIWLSSFCTGAACGALTLGDMVVICPRRWKTRKNKGPYGLPEEKP